MYKFIRRIQTRFPTAIAALLATLLLTAGVRASNEGAFTSLSANDAPDFNQTITISATLVASDSIHNSNVYYELIAPDGVTVVATHTTDIPVLEAGQTFSDSWTTTNSSFPGSGTYTLNACWNNGNSTNCQIASAQTTFFSVPASGFAGLLVGAVLLGWFLWRQRTYFRQPAGAQAQTTEAEAKRPEGG